MPVIRRQLPNTDARRALALDRAALKLNITAPADVVLSAQTQTRLAATRADFNQKLVLRGQALGNQGALTPEKDAKRRIAALYVSHFIQGCDKAALRGEPGFALADRSYFQLEATNDRLPPLDHDDEVYLWGQRLIAGNVQRLAAGKPVMPFPAIADVTTHYNAFVDVYGDYSLLKTAYDDAQEAISNMREDVDSLVLRIWNEVEAAYSEEDAPSKRRNARDWGVFYVVTGDGPPSPDDFSIVGTITDSITGQPVEDVQVKIAQTEDLYLTDGAGRFYIDVLPPGTYTLYIQHLPDYQNQVVSNVIVTEGTINELFIQAIPAGGFGAINGVVQQAGAGVAASVTIEGTPIVVNTDPATGAFMIPNVPAGAQFIRVILDADPTQFQARLVDVPTGNTITENFSFA